MKKSILALLCACLLGFGLAGCGQTTNGVRTQKRPSVESELLQFQQPAEGDPIAIFTTDYGQFRAVLYPDEAPMAVENFIALANEGYYNGLPFHRVISDFIIQSGDATGSGNGGTTCWDGMPFPVEISNKLHHFSGALCMAHMGSDTSANFSQFYVVQTPPDSISDEDAQTLLDKGMDQAVADAYKAGGGAPYLDYYNTIFGQVYEGMEVVDAIAIASDPDQDGKPRSEVILTSVQISSYGSPDPSPLPASEAADSAASSDSAGTDSSASSAPAS